ncbi:unnamed protein product [Amoebophrya sp. A25]|nr:unnamed protein product [Amoebophrya sp. A25]|eukprot:GSA25T00004237001.1
MKMSSSCSSSSSSFSVFEVNYGKRRVVASAARRLLRLCRRREVECSGDAAAFIPLSWGDTGNHVEGWTSASGGDLQTWQQSESTTTRRSSHSIRERCQCVGGYQRRRPCKQDTLSWASWRRIRRRTSVQCGRLGVISKAARWTRKSTNCRSVARSFCNQYLCLTQV